MLKRFRNRFLSCLLPAILLFAQQAAMAHLASHAAGEPPDPENSLVHVKLCNKCLSVEKLTSAVTETGQKAGLPQHHFNYNVALAAQPLSRDAIRQSCRDPPETV
ncbi:MAG TPA: hypothetical protein VMW70_11365 [Burkholderiales bacterium]|nr:hypothetical protein [Burkholderiales bacterium]